MTVYTATEDRRMIAPGDRILGSDAAQAVGRFNPDGPDGYRAKTPANAPIRPTRAEAVEDERSYWIERDRG